MNDKPWRPLRTDDLERLQAMTVQLEQAKSLIQQNTATHGRLAFMLLDNAAEILMFRNVEVLLAPNYFNEQLLRQFDELLDQRDDPELRRQREQTASEYVSKTKRKALSRYFDVKADFLQERGCIELSEARALKKLHYYRNETYHRDLIRNETIRSACLLYFDLVCALFGRLRQFDLQTLTATPPPLLAKYLPADVDWSAPTADMIAAQLRAGLDTDDSTLRQTLITHLTSRLDDVEVNLAYAEQAMFAVMLELAPTGPWREVVVRLAQVHEDEAYEEPPAIEALLQLKLRYTPGHLLKWRADVERLQALDDRLSLFGAYADIEDEFEPFEVCVDTLVDRIGYEEQMEEDIRRGK
jgi:hypothetical protein